MRPARPGLRGEGPTGSSDSRRVMRRSSSLGCGKCPRSKRGDRSGLNRTWRSMGHAAGVRAKTCLPQLGSLPHPRTRRPATARSARWSGGAIQSMGRQPVRPIHPLGWSRWRPRPRRMRTGSRLSRRRWHREQGSLPNPWWPRARQTHRSWASARGRLGAPASALSLTPPVGKAARAPAVPPPRVWSLGRAQSCPAPWASRASPGSHLPPRLAGHGRDAWPARTGRRVGTAHQVPGRRRSHTSEDARRASRRRRGKRRGHARQPQHGLARMPHGQVSRAPTRPVCAGVASATHARWGSPSPMDRLWRLRQRCPSCGVGRGWQGRHGRRHAAPPVRP